MKQYSGVGAKYVSSEFFYEKRGGGKRVTLFGNLRLEK